MRVSFVGFLASACALSARLFATSAASPSVPRVEAPPELAFSAFASDPNRQFDFWLGEWDARLAAPGPDGNLDDAGTMREFVYPILEGKAVLESWTTSTSSGLSVRYYDPARRGWAEWAIRSGADRLSVTRYDGGFRHGRADLRHAATTADGSTVTTAHVFSDITPFSLRWEETTSADNGTSWRLEQIREMTRYAVEARQPILRDFAPPLVRPGRCDDEGFRAYEILIGRWRGEGLKLDLAPVLDGCAVLGILEVEEGPDQLILETFDAPAKRWLTLVVDGAPGTGLAIYSGASAPYDLVADPEGEFSWLVAGKDLRAEGARLVLRRAGRKFELSRMEAQARRAP